MKLLILSDLHAEFEPFEVPKGLDYDVVILAGDIVAPGRVAARWLRHPARFRDKPIVQIAGNHEYYESVLDQELAEMHREAQAHGIHFLDGDEVVIAGVRSLGCTLWTDFALRIDSAHGPYAHVPRSMGTARRQMLDYRVIRTEVSGQEAAETKEPHRRLTPEDTLAIHQAQRQWLATQLAQPFGGPTVVVTHHAPHRQSLSGRYADDWCSGAFVGELPDEFFRVPVLWVHGHTHTSFDYRVGHCRVVCNPRGYMNRHGEFENQDFDPGWAVDL
ncbi:putative phosphodiesterase [Variovorax paradoxus]|uniref:metallophosphoesterase n=1 Tax=Variovorax paradoxus TaxID=34073 RepID=UPI00278471E4|nr:metallophosphoesterase [Variovorax paradoxus]MDP9967519.1 putative phosphodiesterase [Variovorax paradoxus]